MSWQIIVGAIFLIGGIANIFKDLSAFVFGIAVGLCLLYWGLKKKGYIKRHVPQAQIPARTLKEENFCAAGVNYYEDNIQKLACSNPDWKLTASEIINRNKAGKPVFRYNYINKPVQLIPEPENEHDSNAIIVQIAGEKVGYISRSENIHVKDILRHSEIESISAFIGGGEYKTIQENGVVMKDKSSLNVNVRIKYIW